MIYLYLKCSVIKEYMLSFIQLFFQRFFRFADDCSFLIVILYIFAMKNKFFIVHCYTVSQGGPTF